MGEKEHSGCNGCGDCASCFEGVTIPVGPKGDQGVPGMKGETGPIGVTGLPGNGIVSYVFTSNSQDRPEGTPGTIDNYTITFTDGTTVIVVKANGNNGDDGPQGDQGIQGPVGSQGPQGLPGPQGDPGTQGEPGTVTFFISGPPSGGLGDEGDIAYDTTTVYPQINIYQKQGGIWVLQGTFGNVVNAGGGPAENSYLFRATKIVNSIYTTNTEEFLAVEDDVTVPNFDNGGVWNGVKFVSDQSLIDTEFKVENMILDNNTAAPIVVDIRIYKNSGGIETLQATNTTIMLASETGTSVTFSSVIASLLALDEVYLKVELSAPGNVTVKDGVFYNINV